MAINLLPPRPEEIYPIAGIVLGTAEAGIRKAGERTFYLLSWLREQKLPAYLPAIVLPRLRCRFAVRT